MKKTSLSGELKTIRAMLGLWCRAQHRTKKDLCADCAELLAYAGTRLARCPYGEGKPVCRRCPVHCYQPARRQRMREVMRYAGPRLFWRHPLLVLRHLGHGFSAGKKEPPR